MLRRIGYILGLLFVAACIAAYPLTWGRIVGAEYQGDQRIPCANMMNGQLSLTFVWSIPKGKQPYKNTGFWGWNRPEPESDFSPTSLYRVRVGRTSGPLGEWARVQAPLWMPALPVSLFMAWRWRRRRRRQVAGFPLDQRTETSETIPE